MNALRFLFCLLLATASACEPDRSRSTASSQTGNETDEGTEHTSGTREYGDGEYAIILTTGDHEPSKYCWYIEETVRVWSDGSGAQKRTTYNNLCVEGGVDCYANEPIGESQETSSSWVRVSYETVGLDALYGTCDHLDRYWADDSEVECLFHKHCYGAAKCVDYLCICPEGQDCPDPSAPGGGAGGEPDAGAQNNGAPDAGAQNNGEPDAGASTGSPDASAPVGPPGG